MHFIDIGGITLHFRHTASGDKPLLAFVNSLGTDFRIWDAVVDMLGRDFSILLYDKRGHGLSDLGAPPYTITDHVDDLSGLLDHIGAKEVVVCGLSVGGLVAQGLSARRPEMVSALILCDTAHKIGTAELWDQRIAAIGEKGIAAIADGILERWYTPAFRGNRGAELAGSRNMLIRQPAEGYAGTCAALRAADHTELVQAITVPTLCVVGDQDGSTPPDLVRSMAALIPGAEFAVIADAGHIPCVEQPSELVRLIRTFIGKTPQGAQKNG